MKEILDKLEEEVKSMFHTENSGHDIYHLKRVNYLSLHIQEKEGGDRLVIGVASFLHDIHRIMEKEIGKYVSPVESLPRIEKILNKTNLLKDEKIKVLHCIEYHEEYAFSEKGKAVNDIETLIVQDADNLDGIGAIGIARGFSFAGAHKIPIWIPHLPFNRKHYDESIKDPSEIHHFYSKLLKLKDNMNTETAKKMALERHKFIEYFLDEFFKEWKGEK